MRWSIWAALHTFTSFKFHPDQWMQVGVGAPELFKNGQICSLLSRRVDMIHRSTWNLARLSTMLHVIAMQFSCDRWRVPINFKMGCVDYLAGFAAAILTISSFKYWHCILNFASVWFLIMAMIFFSKFSLFDKTNWMTLLNHSVGGGEPAIRFVPSAECIELASPPLTGEANR